MPDSAPPDRWRLHLLIAAVALAAAQAIDSVDVVLSGGLRLELGVLPLLAAGVLLGPAWGAAVAAGFAGLTWDSDVLRAALVVGEVTVVGALAMRGWAAVLADVVYWLTTFGAVAIWRGTAGFDVAATHGPGWMISGAVGTLTAQGLAALPTLTALVDGPRPRRPLRDRISNAVIPLCAVAVLSLGVGLSEMYAATLRRVAGEELATRAHTVATRMADDIADAEANVLALAEELSAHPHDVASVRASLQRHHSAAQLQLTMIVTDADGQVNAGSSRVGRPTPAPTGSVPPVTDRAYFAEPRATGRPYRSGAFLGRGFGTDPIVALSAPIRDTHDRGFAGVVEASLDLRALGLRLRDLIPETGWSLAVVDHDGNAAVTAGDDAARLLAPGSSIAWVVELNRAPAAASTVVADAHIGAKVTAPALGWRVYVRRSIAAIEAPMQAFHATWAAWLALCLLVSAPVVGRVSRVMAEPLERLASDAERVGAGDTLRVPPPAPDAPLEVARLHGELESMLGRLDSSLEELETRVRNRTATLAATTARADAVFRATNDGKVLIDRGGIVRDVNAAQCAMVETTPEELIGQPVAGLESGAAPDLLPSWWRSLHDGGALRFETTLRTRAGRDVPVEASVTVLSRDSGDVLATFRDVSERRRNDAERARLEAALRQSQKMEAVGTLAGGIAHDFNNILTVITGGTTAALDALAPHHHAVPPLRQVAGAATRAKALVGQILAFSRRTDGERQLVHVRSLVEDSLELVRASLPAMIAIRTEFEEPLPAVEVDPIQLHQVIVNLATNAADAMKGRAGRLTVSAQARVSDGTGARVEIAVTDTGCGVSDADLPRIFDPFFTTKPLGTGTGLGLAVVHGIVTGHGGSLGVRSVVGEGTTVTVSLPAAPLDAIDAVSAVPTGTSESPPRGGGYRVLIVDDEPDVLDLVTSQFDRFGFVVRSARDGAEALAVVEATPGDIDVVVSDIAMPAMSGLELAARLRGRPAAPAVVLCSGYLTDADEREARALDVAAVIAKPYSIAELARQVIAVVGARPPARRCQDPAHAGSRSARRGLPET